MYDTWRLRGLPDGRGLNVAYEAVDRHVSTPAADRVAIRWIGARGEGRELTYAELCERTSRFANTLLSLAVSSADRVVILLGAVPELHVALLGAIKAGAVAVPLSTDFEPELIVRCLQLCWGRIVVTTPALYEAVIAPARDQLPDLKSVLLVGEDGAAVGGELPPGGHDLHQMFRRVPAEFIIPVTDSEDPALVLFARGGRQGVVGTLHTHGLVGHHHVSSGYALDLLPGDRYWCSLPPTSVPGVCYGIIAPLTHGATLIVGQEDLDPAQVHAFLRREQVEVWYTTPSVIGALQRAGIGRTASSRPPRLRFVASAGEPARPGDRYRPIEIYGLSVYEGWWQTETGGIVIASPAHAPTRPGSIGRPIPGVEAAIIRRDADGHVEVLGSGADGELAIRVGWGSMFRTYLGDGLRYRDRFVDGWYLSGDRARRDPDGWYWFLGRGDESVVEAAPRDAPDLNFLDLRIWLSEPKDHRS